MIDWTKPEYRGSTCIWCGLPQATKAAWKVEDDGSDYAGSEVLCWATQEDCPEAPMGITEAYQRGWDAAEAARRGA